MRRINFGSCRLRGTESAGSVCAGTAASPVNTDFIMGFFDLFRKKEDKPTAVPAAADSAAASVEAQPEQRRAAEPPPRPEREEIRRYDPPKRNPPKLAPRVSRLDSLLQEESDDSHYDIDDILKSIEKSK